MEFLIPSRASRSGDDPIFALNAEARARASSGESVVNATVGAILDDEGDLAVLPTVVQALRDVDPVRGAAYAPIAGANDFLDAVIRDVFGQSAAASTTVAVATPGGSGALRHAIACFLQPQQAVLTPSFYWGPYKTLADEQERTLATFRMFDEAGRLDTADMERKLTGLLDAQGRALVLLNSPCNNPTGYSFDDREWIAIADVIRSAAARGPISLLIDFAYARYGSGNLAAMMEICAALAGKALVLFAWSASKSFTQYGLRVGALLAVHPDAAVRKKLQSALAYACRGTWSNCNAGGMAGIAEVLTDPSLRARVEQEREGLRELLHRRVAWWNELASPAGLVYPRYEGGFFTTVFCPDAPRAAAKLKDDGVFVVPQAGALRVALSSVAERDIPRLVSAIAGALR